MKKIFPLITIAFLIINGIFISNICVAKEVNVQSAEKYNKPCIIVCFGSRWVYDFVSEAAAHSESNLIIPIMTRINQAIKAFKMMYEFGQSKNN